MARTVRMRCDLVDDNAVIEMARMLSQAGRVVQPELIVGGLPRLWGAVADVAKLRECLTGGREAVVRGMQAVHVDQLARVDGIAGAMVAVGWLKFEPVGAVFPRWDKYNPVVAAGDKLTAADVAANRVAGAKLLREGGFTAEAEYLEAVPGKNGKRKAFTAADVELPPGVQDTKELRDALAAWIAHKIGKRQAYSSPKQLTILLAEQVEKFGADAAAFASAIRTAIGCNYAGFFTEKVMRERNRVGLGGRQAGWYREPDPGNEHTGAGEVDRDAVERIRRENRPAV